MSDTFRDIDLRLPIDPNGDIALLYDTEAIKQSIKNICGSQQWDIPFNAVVYAGLNRFQFEQATQILSAEIKKRIEWIIKLMEPRITLTNCNVVLQPDLMSYQIQLLYTINITKKQDSLNVSLPRMR